MLAVIDWLLIQHGVAVIVTLGVLGTLCFIVILLGNDWGGDNNDKI